MSPSFLKVSGAKLVDGQGHEVILRGAGLGGWMNMENFISGSAIINDILAVMFMACERISWT